MELNNYIESIKSIVSRILKRDEKARNNYNWLAFQVWKEMGYKIYIDYDLVESMPSFESISRVAREIQNNEQKFTPNKEESERRNKLNKESKKVYQKKECDGLMKNSQYY